jgi:hypothetical protein
VRRKEATVIFILGVIGLILGTVTALGAERFPRRHRMRIEQVGGNLFVAGLALLGFGFPLV